MANDKSYTNDSSAEKNPINAHNQTVLDGDVIIHKKSKASHISVKRTHVAIFLIVVIIVIVTVGLLSGLLTADYWKRKTNKTSFLNESLSFVTSPGPTIDPSLPWGRIRLPKTLLPSQYWLHLRVDLSTFIFVGDVNITVTAHARAEYAVLHSLGLRVNRSTTSVVELLGNGGDERERPLTVTEQFDVITHQFYVIKVSPALEKGRRYSIRIGEYWGLITDDLRGLYRSSYLDTNGKRR